MWAYLENGQAHAVKGTPWRYERSGEVVEPTPQLAPVEPWAIVGIALNYKAHAAETGKKVPPRPCWFMKLPGALQAPEGEIRLPRHLRSDKVDYEGELAVVLGREARNVTPAEAMECVFGYTIANDVSSRDWQYEWGGGQYCRAKSFDTFCPMGPVLVTADEVPDPEDLMIRTWLNGEKVQESSTNDLVFSIGEIVAHLAGSTTLQAGTVILTGTPSGVGHAMSPPRYLRAGDVVEIEIEGLGGLRNPVVEE